MTIAPPRRLALLLGFVFAFGCADADTTPAEAPEPAKAEAAASAPAPKPVAAKASVKRAERPIPAFEGRTLDGESLSISSLLGKRNLFFFFNPSRSGVEISAKAVAALADERADHNFRIVGVGMSGKPEESQAVLDEYGLEIPTLYDDQAAFIRKVTGQAMATALVLTDAEGYMIQATGAFANDGSDPAAAAEDVLREWLRLDRTDPTSTAFGDRPHAPTFTAQRLDGGEFDLASLKGTPTILIFFLHTCPHCHKALASMKKTLDGLPEEQRATLIGLSMQNRPSAVKAMLEDEGLDFFPVIFDPTERVREAYGAMSGVPVIFLLDAEQRIVARVDGWKEDRDPPLMRMRLARLGGATVPMLLHSTAYSGDEFCAVCHEGASATHELTTHATAFDTLVKHGADADPECVGCHVVGWEQKGGFEIGQRHTHLEGVGCETSHGRGGPHLSPDVAAGGNYEAVCVTCHNPQHSLGFEYATFLPKVSHAANTQYAQLTGAERDAFLASRRATRKNLLPTQADYVGSAICRDCHVDEFTTWIEQPHAKAYETLEAKNEAGNTECLGCHTTGMDKTGGFVLGGPTDKDLAAVGCESCHGPGGDHVGEDAVKRGTILSLGDKCDSCVILQICGSCHDDANDPGFEFEVQEKIDRQRHGTIEPSTGSQAHHHGTPPTPSAPTVHGLLDRAFATGDPS